MKMMMQYRTRRRSLLARWGVVLILAAAVWTSHRAAGGPQSRTRSLEPSVEVLFSPDGGCEDRLVDLIEEAQDAVRVQMYMFTSRPISKALVAAQKRGVAVTVILDSSQEARTYVPWRVMKRGGVKVYFDGEHSVANNKVLIVDDRIVATGSYNYTKAAEEKNAENVVILENDADVVEKYLDNFKEHLGHARRAS